MEVVILPQTGLTDIDYLRQICKLQDMSYVCFVYLRSRSVVVCLYTRSYVYVTNLSAYIENVSPSRFAGYINRKENVKYHPANGCKDDLSKVITDE